MECCEGSGPGAEFVPEARPGAEVGCPELWVLVLFVQGVHLQSDRMGPRGSG